MTILEKLPNYVEFESISHGEIFKKDGSYYMDIFPCKEEIPTAKGVTIRTVNAVNLSTGELEYFRSDAVVEVVSGEFHVA